MTFDSEIGYLQVTAQFFRVLTSPFGHLKKRIPAGRTDGRTDSASHRDAWTYLKRTRPDTHPVVISEYICYVRFRSHLWKISKLPWTTIAGYTISDLRQFQIGMTYESLSL